jgi:type IV pilus assembly protein PilF
MIIKTIIKTAVIVSCLSFLAACETTTSTKDRNESRIQEPNLQDAAELNTELAIGYIQRKQYKPARDKLEKAIEQNPDYLLAYQTLAYLYAILGQTEKAEIKDEEASNIDSMDSALASSYGTFLCTQGKFDKAQKKLKMAYSDPFYESGYLAESNAGSCYVQQGEFKKAESLLRRSLRVNSKIPGSLISMAEVGLKTDRNLMARAYIERYFALKSPSAESLWIASQAEKNLGDQKHYMKYARKIIHDFPDSDQAGWVEAQARSERLKQ